MPSADRAGTAPVREGDVVAGKYRVERVLGAGGMGIVVAASHLQLQQRVAIKFLLSGVVAGPDSTVRFLREARAAARIQSEHVARVLDAATMEDGTPYMVMEFLEGRDLAALLEQRGPLPLEEAVGYILQACEGIAEAHAAGIVHRDLKPSNFFLCERASGRPVVKVLDFGVSKVAGASSTQPEMSLTGSSAFLGSPLYMSPEQMASAKHVDERADIWSLGVTLFELVTGRVPFGGTSVTEVIAGVLQKPPLSLREVAPGLAPGFESALARSLEKERERRYSNVAEFAAAIAPFGPRHSVLSVERISDVLGAARKVAPVPDAIPAGALTGPAAVSPSPSPLAASGPAADFAHDATAAVSNSPVTPRLGGTTAQPVSNDHGEALRQEPRSLGGRRLVVAGALVAIVGVGGAAVVMRLAPASRTASTAQLPSPSVPATTSVAVPVTPATSSPGPRPPDPVTTLEPPASTATGRRPPIGTHATASSPPPAVSSGKGATTAPPAPATAPSCHVVQYFDADGETHFKKECP
ncbi:MAG: protein kinase domain-containing protein [Polyangiaceae bacterium]